MVEQPILFSGPMVKAILAGRKTQTRRKVKLPDGFRPGPIKIDQRASIMAQVPWYAQPGDHLWVRETWQYADWTEDGYPWVRYRADDAKVCIDRGIPSEWAERLTDIWAGLSDPANYDIDGRAADRRWRPGIHMPRWACRIVLKVKSMSVGRLSDMAWRDVQAEGMDLSDMVSRGDNRDMDARRRFGALWDSINGAGSWDTNPWVWVVEFKRVAALDGEANRG